MWEMGPAHLMIRSWGHYFLGCRLVLLDLLPVRYFILARAILPSLLLFGPSLFIHILRSRG